MHLVKSLALLAVALAGCSAAGNDGSVHHDAGNLDAPGRPPPPTLGVQIDRLGRPAINTMLIGLLTTPAAAQTARKDAYNHAPDPAAWGTTLLEPGVSVEQDLEVNLAVFDALDKGLSITKAGCGNAMSYAGPANPASYQAAADLLADDQLYVDTSRTTCSVYLALEIEQVSAGSFVHTTCGGRTLTHDAIDVTYSMLAASYYGLDPAVDLGPRLHDGVAAHTDVKDTFPFLGPPH
jgi:hypothetical protein